MYPTDKLGNRIEKGSYIAYALRIGNSAQLGVYKVLDFHESKKHYQPVPTGYTFDVVGIEDWYGKPRLKRPSKLDYRRNIIVIPSEKMPQKYKELFDNVGWSDDAGTCQLLKGGSLE